jgi:hypothetical protein
MATRTPRRRERLPFHPPTGPEPIPAAAPQTEPTYPYDDDHWRELPPCFDDDAPWPPKDPAELAALDAHVERQGRFQAAADDYARLELDMLIGRYEAEPQHLTRVREKLMEYRSLRAALDETELDPAF